MAFKSIRYRPMVSSQSYSIGNSFIKIICNCKKTNNSEYLIDKASNLNEIFQKHYSIVIPIL